jgi:hypothetical protein
VIIISCLLVIPTKTSAAWWFSSRKEVNTQQAPAVDNYSLDGKSLSSLSTKYKIWVDSFEKRNIESVIINQNNFSFSVAELNYLFETESAKVKNPTITNFHLTSSGNNLNISGNFQKFIRGHFSFIAQVVSVDKKLRLHISYVKLYGLTIPSKWLVEPINKAIDDYLSFLYIDNRYQGFTFSNNDGILKLKPEFSK